ncbi:uncharacterized protein LOC120352997 [Nilaparvata lugens]|uniref:uncharacterized protein LOC120352997 n=1 Tax=Nilaparvata lugens TaxID=108931 RepID=UPI00193CC945|nr:uncharacterized protein LOC120352997 [Nilaparvata lugens]
MAYERFRADRLLSSKRTYMGLRRSYQRAARAARMRYNSELIDRAPNRCKAAWGIIRAAAGVPAPGAVPVSADDLHDAWTSSIRGICEGIRASPVVAADLLSASVRPPALRLLTWRRITCDDVTRVVNCLSNSSVILYGLPLWGGATDVARVLRLQKRALRIICGAGRLAHCRPLFIKERILTVLSLYVLHTLCRTHANVGLLVTRQSFHPYETRGRLRLDLPYQRLSRTRTGLAHMSISLYNRLPLLARDLPAVRFRGALRSLLTDHPLYSLREFCMLESSVLNWFVAASTEFAIIPHNLEHHHLVMSSLNPISINQAPS